MPQQLCCWKSGYMYIEYILYVYLFPVERICYPVFQWRDFSEYNNGIYFCQALSIYFSSIPPLFFW